MKSKPRGRNERSSSRLGESHSVPLNFICTDPDLRSRMHLLERTCPGISFLFSPTPLDDPAVALYLLPLRDLGLLESPDRFHFKPVVVYGPAHGIYRSFQAGCSDYLRDPWDERELIARTARFTEFAAVDYPWGLLLLRAQRLTGPGGAVVLTACQTLLLRCLIRFRGRRVSRRVLAHILWGEERPESRSLDMHIAGLRRRISRVLPADVRGVILTCRPYGYMLR